MQILRQLLTQNAILMKVFRYMMIVMTLLFTAGIYSQTTITGTVIDEVGSLPVTVWIRVTGCFLAGEPVGILLFDSDFNS